VSGHGPSLGTVPYSSPSTSIRMSPISKSPRSARGASSGTLKLVKNPTSLKSRDWREALREGQHTLFPQHMFPRGSTGLARRKAEESGDAPRDPLGQRGGRPPTEIDLTERLTLSQPQGQVHGQGGIAQPPERVGSRNNRRSPRRRERCLKCEGLCEYPSNGGLPASPSSVPVSGPSWHIHGPHHAHALGNSPW
jgi:hypothetical protein